MGIDVGLFVDAIPSDCVCTICSEVLEDPLETQNCQHAFCKSCITTWLTTHSTCPLCRQGIGGHSGLRQLHRIWREKLYSLKVRCCFHSNGCDDDMALFQLSDHLSSCPYKEVLCPNEKCKVTVLRGDLNDHIQVCLFRTVRCQECDLELISSKLQEHKCVNALRKHFDERMGVLKSELSEFIRTTQQERMRMEAMMEEQRNQIETLQHRITVLINQRKRVRSPAANNLIVPSTSSTRLARNAISPTVDVCPSPSSSPLPPVDRIPREEHGQQRTERTNTSLPRLAPLHTHMSLANRSAPGGEYYRLLVYCVFGVK